jgi:hypothetical protein
VAIDQNDIRAHGKDERVRERVRTLKAWSFITVFSKL